jgi:hypothetical protein
VVWLLSAPRARSSRFRWFVLFALPFRAGRPGGRRFIWVFGLRPGALCPLREVACPVSHREFGTVGAVAAEAADADGQVLGSRTHRIGGFSLTISSPTGWGGALRKSTCMIELRAEEMRTSLLG